MDAKNNDFFLTTPHYLKSLNSHKKITSNTNTYNRPAAKHLIVAILSYNYSSAKNVCVVALCALHILGCGNRATMQKLRSCISTPALSHTLESKSVEGGLEYVVP